jgi:triacylglycerol lipase
LAISGVSTIESCALAAAGRAKETLVVDVLSALCPRLNAPIVLAHGLFGFHKIGVGPLTLAKYFRGVPEFLEAAGNRVMVSQVPPIAGIERRSRVLGRRIRAAFGGEPVHLIAHSMGGLDARALLASEGDSGLILSLTTIATPHLGSALADFAKIGFGRVYRLLAAFKVDHSGFLDLTRRSARAFHRRNPAPKGVPCFSVAGDPDAEEVCRPLRRLHAALSELEGPNDGLVSAESANAFGEPMPTWRADHLRQMGWFAPRGGLSVLSLYIDLMANLAALGFEARRGAVSVGT